MGSRSWEFPLSLTPTNTDSQPRLIPWLLLGVVLVAGLFYGALHSVAYVWDFEAVWQYRQKFFTGWWVTIRLAAASLVLSTLFGLLTALARRSSRAPLRAAALGYVELVRGTPLLVQILLLYYGVANAVGMDNRYVAGVVILSLFAGAYIGEIIRAGIESVPGSQIESARALGFSDVQVYRFVILPQAGRQVLPALTGQFVSLIKDSSLLCIIGVEEFTLSARQINSNTYSTLESYLPLAFGYLLLTLPLSLFTARLEERLRYAA